MLWLACRHHMLEVVLRTAGEKIFGKSPAPTNKEFKVFQGKWSGLNKSTWRCLETSSSDWMEIRRKKVIEELQYLLKNHSFLRDDYKEVAELCNMVLGGKDLHLREEPKFSDEYVQKLAKHIQFVALFVCGALAESSSYPQLYRATKRFASLPAYQQSYWQSSPGSLWPSTQELAVTGLSLNASAKVQKRTPLPSSSSIPLF